VHEHIVQGGALHRERQHGEANGLFATVTHDLFGRELKVTIINRVDSLAATACLLMGESVQKTPAVLVQGLPPEESTQTARDLIRPLHEDLFR